MHTWGYLAGIVDLAALGAALFFVVDMTHKAILAKPQDPSGLLNAGWQRMLGTARNSATWLWSKVVTVVALVAYNTDSIADMLGQPQWNDTLTQWGVNPKVISTFALSVMMVNFAARKRTLGSN